MRWWKIGLGVVVIAAAAWGVLHLHQRARTGTESAVTGMQPAFVGRETCATCHEAQTRLWSGSHHDLAMQEATERTVLGDFNQATITHFGATSTFFRRDGKFMVRTDGPDGALREYAITYTFGAVPLQQYLIEFPGGRFQALGLAWDSRPKAQGGQRWFHLYPNERIPHGDELHWTGRNQNWNFMCAACHSTDVRKNYDLAQNRYRTTWSELDVSCEACHGPGSAHVAWARSGRYPESDGGSEHRGLVIRLREADSASWERVPGAPTARRRMPRVSHMELETCAQCHSRRTEIHRDKTPGAPYLDGYLPALLEPGLYHADGQILDEVYVYGSFVQSKMHRAGVTCSDCHEPHGLRLRAAGNALCARCHDAAVFDTERHHFHKPASRGSLCVECHMPGKAYMVLDFRRDHSLRVPRPDLSVTLGTPNACTVCHTNRPAQWAAKAIEKWHGPARSRAPHYGEALAAGRANRAGADAALAILAGDTTQPGIARATSLELLRHYPGPLALEAIRTGLHDPDPLVRIGALRGLEAVITQQRPALAGELLRDPLRAVRIEAARALASVPTETLSPSQHDVLNQASADYIEVQLANAESPNSHLNLGIFYADRRQVADAESAYRTAITLDPGFVPAHVNLADLYRALNQDEKGEPLLREALRREPRNAEAHHALGLLLVRRQQKQEALASFQRAATLRPDDSRYAYVYAVALHSYGKTRDALTVLERALARRPDDRELLTALVSVNQAAGRLDAARRYAERLLKLAPNDPAALALRDQVRSGGKADPP